MPKNTACRVKGHAGYMKNSDAGRQNKCVDQSLSRERRLTSSSQFKRAYNQKRMVYGQFMVVWLHQDENSNLRLGVVASKKVGKAVARNRAKRLLREAFRLNRHAFKTSYDVVLVARRAILKAKLPVIEEELLSLLRKLGVDYDM